MKWWPIACKASFKMYVACAFGPCMYMKLSVHWGARRGWANLLLDADGYDLCLVWVEWYGMSMYVMCFFENMKVHWLCLTGFLVHDCVLLTPSRVQDHHLLLRLLLFNTAANEEHLMAWDKTVVIRLDYFDKNNLSLCFLRRCFFTMRQRAKVSLFSDCKVLFGCFFLKNQ